MADSGTRIESIEASLSHLDRSIEVLQEVVADHTEAIAALERHIRTLHAKLDALRDALTPAAPDAAPPAAEDRP